VTLTTTISTELKRKRFTHDCDNCEYLGQSKEFDLYTCEQGGMMRTFIARYGNKGHEYTSMPWIAMEPISASSVIGNSTLTAVFEAWKRYEDKVGQGRTQQKTTL